MDPEYTGVALAVSGLVVAAAAAGAPSGAGMLIGAVGMGTGVAGVCDPTEFARSATAWGLVAQEVLDNAAALNTTYQRYREFWIGDASEAFQDYWEQTLFPLLEPLQGVAQSLEDAASALLSSSVQYLAAFFGTTAVCLATELAALPLMAPPATGAGMGIQWTAASVFAGLVSGYSAALLAQYFTLSTATGQVVDALKKLESHLKATVAGDLAKLAPPVALPEANAVPTSYYEGSEGVGRNPKKDAD
ncbi:MAG: WXG100 family type VII secretion target [Propionibacteriales bacterium]|nr:WXG100 family type VII secretion target [Propionibacteriales bacterium]